MNRAPSWKRVGVAGSAMALALLLAATSEPASAGGLRIGLAERVTEFTPPVPPAASTPNRELITLLRHPVGVAIVGLLTVATGIAAARVFLPIVSGPSSAARHGMRPRRRRGRSPATETGDRTDRTVTALLAATLAAGILLLPLVFSIAFDDVFAMPKSWLLWTLAAVVLVLLVVAVVRGERPISFGFLELFAAAFVLFNLAATIVAGDPWHAVVGERRQYQGLLSMTAYAILFVAARFAFSASRHVRALSLAAGISASVAAGYGILQWVGLDPLWSDLFKGRIFSTMGQANWLAAFLAASLILVIPLMRDRRPSGRLALAVVVPGIILALFLTFGRGGYVALVAGLLVAGIVLMRGIDRRLVRRIAARATLGIAAALLAIAGIAAIWQPVGDVVDRVGGRVATIADLGESSNRIRLDLWAVATAITQSHPLTGTGPDSYVLVFPNYRDLVLAPDRATNLARFRPESPHNVYLAVASGAGLPALTALVALIGASFGLGVRAALKAPDSGDRFALAGLMGGTMALTFANGFMTGEPATSALWFVLVGALSGCSSALVSASPSTANHEGAPPSDPEASRRRRRRRNR